MAAPLFSPEFPQEARSLIYLHSRHYPLDSFPIFHPLKYHFRRLAYVYTYVYACTCIIKAPTFFFPPCKFTFCSRAFETSPHKTIFLLMPLSLFFFFFCPHRVSFRNSVHHQEMYVFGKVRKNTLSLF